MNSSYISPFAKPVYIMLKPVGSVCNLACEYCYYLEKSKFYPDVKNHIMTDQILEKFIKEYMECQTMQEVLFTWHGGETLMRPISFYKKALELQRKYAGGRQIDNCIQTNGTLLNDEWCQFFKENNFLVGVSIDGPQEFHDEYRRNRQGLPSFYKVMKGIELLKKHGVEYNAMDGLEPSRWCSAVLRRLVCLAGYPADFCDAEGHRPTIMMIDVPPNETFAPNTPLKMNGITHTMIRPTAPINII